MQVSLIKHIYRIEITLIVILFFAVTLLYRFRLFENMLNIPIVCLGIISISNLCIYKNVLEEDSLSTPSVYLIAANTVVCLSYVLCLFFLLGRYFIRYL